MSGSRARRLRELFDRAADLSGGEREALLAACRADDPDLAAELAELLALHEPDDDDDAVDAADVDPLRTTPLGFDRRLDESATVLQGVADASWVDPLPAGTRLGAFTIEGVLAAGGMGTVHRARQDEPARPVALKILATHLEGEHVRRAFRHEARILAHLRHPAIAEVYASGTTRHEGRELPWFAMEFVAGARPITAAARELPRAAVVELLAQVCDAVHHGHTKGVVHRDLKPGNVLVDGQGRPKVIDFGVARTLDVDPELSTAHTLAGRLVGTPAYMSPEQASSGDAEVDTRSDVYSLGVLLFELLTGRLPYPVDGRSLVAVARTIAEAPPDRAALRTARVPVDLCTVLGKALAKDPAERYESAAALAADLRRQTRGEPIAARRPSGVYLLQRWAGRNRLLAVAVLLLVVSLLAGAAGTTLGLLRAERARADAAWERDFLVAMLYDADPFAGLGPEVRLGDVLRRAADRLDDDPPAPAVEAELRAVLGEVLLQLGDHARAAPHLQRALELLRADPTADRARIDKLEMGLLSSRTATVAGDQDLAALRDFHDRQRAALLPGDPARLRAENAYGQALATRGDDAAALGIFERALGDVAEHGERADGDVVASLRNNAALCLRALGRLDEARDQLEQVVRYRLARFGERHPSTSTARGNLATVLIEQGESERAREELEVAFAAQRDILGLDDARTWTAAHNLASLHLRAGRLDQAITLGREVLAARRTLLGSAAHETLQTQSNLAAALLQSIDTLPNQLDQLDRAAEARRLLEEVLEIRARIEAEPSEATANAHFQLAGILFGFGDLNGAGEHYATARRIAEARIPEGRAERWLFAAGEPRVALRRGEDPGVRAQLESLLEEVRARAGDGSQPVRILESWLARER